MKALLASQFRRRLTIFARVTFLLFAFLALPQWASSQTENTVPWRWEMPGHAYGVYSVAFSPDGSRVASSAADRTVKLWDAATGKLLRTLTGHASYVYSVAFSPNGTLLATGGGQYDNTVKLWDATTGKLFRTLTGHTDGVSSVSFSLDGTRLTSGSADRTIKLWDAATGTLLRTLTGHTSGVSSVVLSPDGTRIASGSYDQTVILWDAASGVRVRTLTGHPNGVSCVAFSPDGMRLATGTRRESGIYDGKVRIWDAWKGTLVQALDGHTDGVSSVAFSPDGALLASGSWDGTIKFWDAATGSLQRTLTAHTDWVTSVAFSPDGTRIASGSRDNSRVKIWDASTGALLQALTGHHGVITSAAYRPDGTQLASGSLDNTIKFWDAATGDLLRTFFGHTSWVFSVAVSPDGTRLASGSGDGTVKLWDTATGTVLRSLDGFDLAYSVAFSPDGARLAAGGSGWEEVDGEWVENGTVKVWDVATGALVRTFFGHTSRVDAVAFSPDGTRLASGSDDGTVKLWDTATGTVLRSLDGFDLAYSVAFSPDGARLAAGGSGWEEVDGEWVESGTLLVWDSVTGALLRTLSGHASWVDSVAFSPDGTRLASGSGDGTVKLWGASTGTLLETFSVGRPVSGVSFSPNGSAIVVVGAGVSGVIGDSNGDSPFAFRVSGANPSTLIRRSAVGVRIYGSGFLQESAVRFERVGSATLNASNASFRSNYVMDTTFNTSQAPVGRWDVVVRNPDGREARLSDGIEIIAGAGTPALFGNLEVPSVMRTGRVNSLTVTWGNLGSGNSDAPILMVEATDADTGARLDVPMRTSPDKAWSRGSAMFVGSGSGGDPAELGSGSLNLTTIQFQSPTSVGRIRWKLSKVESLAPEVSANNWEVLSQAVRPAGVDSAAWNKIWSGFTGQIGPDDKSLFTALRTQATYTGSVGSPASDVGDLLNIPLAQATGEIAPVGAIEQATDLVAPAPGLPLAFGRVMTVMTLDRKYKGLFGLGWRHSLDAHVVFSAGRVEVVTPDGRSTTYTRDNLGVWSGGDPGTSYQDVADAVAPHVLTLADGSRMGFDEGGKLRRTSTTNGTGLTLEWDDKRLIRVTHSVAGELRFLYTSSGYVRAIEGPGGRSVEYDYAGDRLVQVRLSGGRAVQYKYGNTLGDPLGGTLERIVYPDGRDRRLTYDDAGRLTGISANGGALPTTIGYGAQGQISVQSPGGTSYVNRAAHGLAGQSQDHLGVVSDFRYDNYLNPVGIARGGRSWTGVGDEAGNLLQGTDSLGQTRGASYTKDLNRLDWFRDAKNNVLDYDYDANGNVKKISYADGTTETFSYNDWGGVISKKNRRGQTTTFGYNGNGQMTSAISPDEVLTYGYDERGNMTSASSSRTGTITMAYDARDFMTRLVNPGGRWFEFEYDNVGRRTKRTGSDSPTLTYSYDDIGRLARINADGALVVSYGYDGAGRLASESHGNGTSTTYGYDAGGRPTAVRHFKGDNLLAAYLYSDYDAFGNPWTVTTPAGIWRYKYDATNQLVGITPPGGALSTTQYDAEGNRVTGYATNGLNQYTAAPGETFTYDADGNMKTRTGASGTTTYGWNASGQLVSVLMSNGDTFTFDYDALGNRTQIKKNGVRTTLVYEGGNLAAEYAADDTLTTRYVYGAGLVARQDAGSVGYYGFDATGHTRILTGADGTVLNQYEVKPFGGFTAIAEAVPNRFRYVGRYGVAEDETGLFHMRARYYDPSLGRFVSSDPIGLLGGQSNLYAYVSNSPHLRVDAEGCEGKWTYTKSDAWLATSGLAQRYNFVYSHEKYTYSAPGEEAWSVEFGPVGWLDLLGGNGRVYGTNVPWLDPRTGKILGSYSGRISYESDLFRRALGIMEKSGNSSVYDALQWNCQDWADLVRMIVERLRVLDQEKLDQKDTNIIGSFDPNIKLGPVGFGTQGWIAPIEEIVYTVKFENLASPPGQIRADAQFISVTDVLDPDVDISSIELLDVTIGDQTIAAFTGYQNGAIRVPRKGSNLLMDVKANFNLGARTLRWTFTAFDPLTGGLPDLDGILPPNDHTGRGEGYVKFRARLKTGLPNRTQVTNSASIVFDTNAAIVTNVWSNLTDGTAPISSANVILPSLSPLKPTIAWKGHDANGSGLASYDVYVRPKGGKWRLWIGGTTKTKATFAGGLRGTTYEFMCIARDMVGNVESKPGIAERTIRIP